jgi:hypothetical protein
VQEILQPAAKCGSLIEAETVHASSAAALLNLMGGSSNLFLHDLDKLPRFRCAIARIEEHAAHFDDEVSEIGNQQGLGTGGQRPREDCARHTHPDHREDRGDVVRFQNENMMRFSLRLRTFERFYCRTKQ